MLSVLKKTVRWIIDLKETAGDSEAHTSLPAGSMPKGFPNACCPTIMVSFVCQ